MGYGPSQTESSPPHLGHRTQQRARREKKAESQEAPAEDARAGDGSAPQFLSGAPGSQDCAADRMASFALGHCFWTGIRSDQAQDTPSLRLDVF